MLEIITYISLIVLLVLLALMGIIILQISASRRETANQSGSVSQLSQQLEQVRTRQEGLNQTLETNLRSGQENINRYLSDSDTRWVN